MKVLYLDIEPFVIHEFIEHERYVVEIADERRLGLDLLSDDLLLLHVHGELLLVLVLGGWLLGLHGQK